MKRRILKCLILIFGFLLIVNPIFSQSKFEISAGLGGPEFFNLKAKYGQNLQVGICVGGFAGHGFFGSHEIFVQGSIAAEVSYHFSGKSKYTEQPPWYILGGLGYYDIPAVGSYGSYNVGFYPRIGRSLNFSKNIGMNLDVGAFLPLSMSSSYAIYKFRVLGSGSVGFFVRL